MATPASPAPVSGPGQLSKRTDGGPVQKLRDLPDAQYGEAATYRDLQKSAPLAQTPQSNRTPRIRSGSSTAGAQPSLTPLNAPTTRPDEPVTAGAATGAGPGPSALGLPAQNVDYSSAKATLQSVAQFSGQPEVLALLKMIDTRA